MYNSHLNAKKKAILYTFMSLRTVYMHMLHIDETRI
jgi:hypothetical protein